MLGFILAAIFLIWVVVCAIPEDKVVKACHVLQKAFPHICVFYEFTAIFLGAARNLVSLYSKGWLFHCTNRLFKFSMKCVMTYGTGLPGTIVKVTDDVFVVCGVNGYNAGEQLAETIVIRTDKQAILYGVGKFSADMRERLIGTRSVLIVLQYEHHHKELSEFMSYFPESIITGSYKAFHKHTSQLDKHFVYTPLDQVKWPEDLVCTKVDGVADEEYLLLHKKHQILFASHFYANPDTFSGIESSSAILNKALDLALQPSLSVVGWNGMPTDNAVIDKDANEWCRQKLEEEHGRWTSVHACHAGFVVHPEFKAIDTEGDGMVSLQARELLEWEPTAVHETRSHSLLTPSKKEI